MPTTCKDDDGGSTVVGDAVCVSGWDGGTSRPKVKRALKSNLIGSNAKTILGVVSAVDGGAGTVDVLVAGEVADQGITGLSTGAGTSRLVVTDYDNATATLTCKLRHIDDSPATAERFVVGSSDQTGTLAIQPRHNSDETGFPRVFNVRAYGAVGDGVADDRDAIAAAMEAANAANGGVVYVPRGRYRIDSELPVLGENVTLRGETSTNAFYSDGTFFETYVEDTVLYFGKFDDANVSTYNAVEHIAFRRMIDTAIAFETTIADATNASPIVIETTAAHPYATGHVVEVSAVTGNTAAIGRWTITVVDATHFSLDGSMGNGPYAGGGTAFDETLFNTDAGAALEARGATFIAIRNCKFLDYPIGVCLDGAETVLLERCFFGGLLTGYQGMQTHGRGLWLADGAQRGRGWTIGQSTNHITVRDSVIGAYADNVYDYGGLGHVFEDCYFPGGKRAFRIGGVDLLSIKRCYSEGGGYPDSSALLRFEATSITVRIEQCQWGGETPSVEVVGGIYHLTLAGNRFGGTAPGASIRGGQYITHCVSMNNWQPQEFVPLVDQEAGGTSISVANVDATSTAAGLGVNRIGPAQAMIDARLIDPTRPVLLVADGTSTRHRYTSSTPQRHLRDYVVYSTLTGTQQGGETHGTDWTSLAAGVGTYDAAPRTIPDQSLAVLHYEVLQWHSDDPTQYAHWRCAQKFHRYGGAVTATTALVDDWAADVTDVAFVQPTFEIDGDDVVVRVQAHPTEDSRVQVKLEAIVVQR